MRENKVACCVDHPKIGHATERTKIDRIASRVLEISNISCYLSVLRQLSQYRQLSSRRYCAIAYLN